MRTAIVVGAGPTGAMLATILARRGYEVAVFEKRPDIRRHAVESNRSINLALMARGARALEHLGLLQDVIAYAVPVRSRAIHTPDGQVVSQPLGRSSDEHVWAVDRNILNAALLDRAESFPNVKIHFGCHLRDIDFASNEVRIYRESRLREEVVRADVILGADGASSAVREAMVRAGLATFEKTKIGHGYKELTLPRAFTSDYLPNSFHSWPRRSFMIFGNPNTDGSLTLTLFLPTSGEKSFETVTRAEQVRELIGESFPDLAPAMSTLVADYLRNPVGTIGTVKGGPWYHQGKVLLVGDAAHAIVPFFGQGMNASLEDCVALDGILDRHPERWESVTEEFYAARRPNTDAVAELALYNYQEIQARVNDPGFRFRREVEFELMRRYPDLYLSAHVQVMFRHEPYRFARDCLALQNALLPQICGDAADMAGVDWGRADELMRGYLGDVERVRRAHA